MEVGKFCGEKFACANFSDEKKCYLLVEDLEEEKDVVELYEMYARVNKAKT